MITAMVRKIGITFSKMLQNVKMRLTVSLPENLVDRKAKQRFEILHFLVLVLPMTLLSMFGTYWPLKWHRFVFDTYLQRFGKGIGDDGDIQVSETKFADVPVRVYKPKNPVNNGVVLYMHGGGFTFLSASAFDFVTRDLAKRLRMLVISIDYRRSPEHLHPTPLLDCENAIMHFLTVAYKEYKVDPNRVILMGDSAGGNLVAVITQRLRNRQVAQPKLQVLIYPWLQMIDHQLPSYQMMAQYEGTALLNRRRMAMFVLHYLVGKEIGEFQDDVEANRHISEEFWRSSAAEYLRHDRLPARYVPKGESYYDQNRARSSTINHKLCDILGTTLWNPNVSPLLQPHLDNLPKAMIITVELDPLRDEGILYVDRLREAGVPVEHRHYDCVEHGTFNKLTQFGSKMMDDVVQYVLDNV